jgi:V-type H+-transporting ATPase subunit a
LTGEVYEPYAFGLDPTWKVASNDLTFQNSYKMKLSVILGVGQMTFGLFLRLGNSIYSVFKKDGVGEGMIDIVFECIPQLVFMVGIFGYLNLLIFIKWGTDWDVAQQCGQGVAQDVAFSNSAGVPWTADDTNRCVDNPVAKNPCIFPAGSQYPDTTSAFTAPNDLFGCNQAPAGIILMLISMVLSPGDVPAPLYAGQKYVQWLLLALAGIAVPMMLVPKPIIMFLKYKKEHAAKAAHGGHAHGDGGEYHEGDSLTGGDDGDAMGKEMLELPDDTNAEHADHSLADLFIHQIIETIEFVLGCVSNTASYLRLWALSLAHAQLAATFWNLVMVKMINVNAWCVSIARLGVLRRQARPTSTRSTCSLAHPLAPPSPAPCDARLSFCLPSFSPAPVCLVSSFVLPFSSSSSTVAGTASLVSSSGTTCSRALPSRCCS